MAETLKRPWTVWTTQAIALLMFLLLGAWVVVGLSFLPYTIPGTMFRNAFAIGLLIGAAGSWLVVFIGLALRHFAGRWCGTGWLLILAAFATYLLISWILSPRGLENAMISYRSMALLLLLVGSIPFFIFLAYRLVWGNRERAFFARFDRASAEPPPPPMFS